MAFPYLLRNLVNVQTEIHLQVSTILIGLIAGALTTLLFTIPPLLDIRGVRPSLIFRRAVEGKQEGMAAEAVNRLKGNWAQAGAALFILLGLAIVASTLADSALTGRSFALGLAAVWVVLLAASAALLRGLKFLVRKASFNLPSPIRHGLANLYRPGNPSAALLAALGLGIMQIMTVYLVQRAAVTDLRLSASSSLPNIFLIDIAPSELDGITTLLKNQDGITNSPELFPIVNSRLVEVDGVPINQVKLKSHAAHHMLQSIPLTWSENIPGGIKVVQGDWWKPIPGGSASIRPDIAVNRTQAEALGLHPGSTLAFNMQGIQFTATVVAIVESDGRQLASRLQFVLPPETLLGKVAATWNGGVHVDLEHAGAVQRTLYAAYPTVTVISMVQVLETIRRVVIQVSYVIQFLAFFSILAGVVILASGIAGTRYRRLREVAVLKTFGGSRSRIAAVFSIEFAVLGCVAGIVGIAAANIVAATVLNRLTVVYRSSAGVNFAALLAISGLTVLTGWMASHRVLGERPLVVLREE
jgi:putative ABC transport system permease protein